MNKSFATNLIALLTCIAGVLLPESATREYVLGCGLFALSGAITNWLAVHMLFEKVPGFYGSGVIVERFEDFKSAIYNLVMDNFFTEENFKIFADAAFHEEVSAENIDQLIDMDEVFDSFLDVVASSKFGGMLAMFGGLRALEPLRDPFKRKFGDKIREVVDNLDLTSGSMSFESFRPTVEKLVKGKLDQLEPLEVKEILEKMIRNHLGWLVVWGGAVGGIIGLLSVSVF